MDDSLSYLVYQLGGCWRRHVNARLAEIGLTHSQFVFLSGLAELAGTRQTVTQSDLCRHLNASRALTSEVVRLLERNRFVDQVPNPEDARTKALELTPEGRRRLDAAGQLLQQAEERLLAEDRALKGRLKRDLQAALAYELRADGFSAAIAAGQ